MLFLLVLLPFVCALAALLPVSRQFRLRLLLGVSVGHAFGVVSFWKIRPPSEFNGFLVLDSLGLILLSVVSALFVIVSVFMLGYFKHEQRDNRTLTMCLLFLLSTMTLVSVSYHMGLLWVAVETTTLFSAPLISFHRNRASLEAIWKYLLVCSVGIALALMGTFFLAIAANETKTLLLPALLSGASPMSLSWLKLSVIFLLVGYGCKMGLAPMHSWKPEAYGQATGMVAVLMAGAVTQCAFLALVRVSQICSKAGLADFYASILIVAGVLSLIVPVVFILGERNIKRVFAYSSIEHMGLLAIGLGLGGIGVAGALFHMMTNALAKAVMFLTAGSIAQKYGSSRVTEVRGIIHVYPVTGVFLVLALLAGTGMFPFATFHSELMILNASVLSGRYWLAGISAVCLALMFVGITRVVLEAVQGRPTEPLLEKKENTWMNTAIVTAVLLLAGLGLWMPRPLENLLQEAALLVKG